MDPKELFELVGMAGLLAALILFTIFSKGREARVRRKIYKSISEEEKKNPGETMEPVFFEQIQGQEIPVRLGFYSSGRMVKIALILLLTNLSPSILAWLFTAVSCIGTGDWALLGQLDYSYNVVWLCLSLPVSVAGFVVFGRFAGYLPDSGKWRTKTDQGEKGEQEDAAHALEDSPQYDRKLGVPLFDCIAAVCHDSLYDYESLSLRGRSRQERGNGDEKELKNRRSDTDSARFALRCLYSEIVWYKACGHSRKSG